MKLFGGTKINKAVRGEASPVQDETIVLPVKSGKIKAAIKTKAAENKRAVQIALWSAAIVLVLVIGLSLGLKLGDKGAEGETDSSLRGDSVSETDKETAGLEESVVVIPLSPAPPAEPAEPETAQEQSSNEERESVRNNNCYTFLLATYDAKGTNIDSIMVSRLDVADGSLNMVGIPRDTLVNVSWAKKRLNTVMANEDNDTQQLLDEIGSILGFSVDYYAFIHPSAIGEMIDAIGGVYFTVPRNMYYDDEMQGLHIYMQAGYQWLDGDKAVQVLSFSEGNNKSGYPNGDIGRIETQHDFLRTLFTGFFENGEIPKLEELADIFAEGSTGNLDADKFVIFAEEFMKLGIENIVFASLPGKNTFIKNLSYYEIAPVEWAEIVNEYLNPYSQEVALHDMDVLMYDPESRSVMSTSGEIIDMSSFY